MGRSRARVLLLIAGAAYLALLVAAPLGSWFTTVVNNLVQLAVPALVAVPATARAARLATGRLAASWWLLCGSCAAWSLGQAAWTWFEVGPGTHAPFPSVADIGFVAALLLMLAGVVAYPAAEVAAVARTRALLDGAMAGAAILYTVYDGFLRTIGGELEGSLLQRTLSITYPAGDLVVVTVMLALFVRARDRWGGPLPPLMLGVAAIAVADIGFAWLNAIGRYASDPLTDVGWVVGFACIAVAARRPASGGGARVPVWATAGRLLPTVLVLPAVVLMAVSMATGRALGPFLAGLGAVLAVLVVARQGAVGLENRRLTIGLEGTVEELRRREEQLRFQALHDPLTLLANRELFRDRLEHLVARRQHGPAYVLFIDLDDFKTVNDSLGHSVGDELLVAFAGRLRACVRAGDTVARFGGDEFAVLCESGDEDATGVALARRIQAALDVAFTVGGRELHVRASIGAVPVAAGVTPDQLLQDADLAMYAAKGAGKGGVALFDPAMRRAVHERLDLVAAVRSALDRGELHVAYQPIFDAITLEVVCHEALLRWQHPERGLLAPAAFLPLAEETGSLGPIAWWTLEAACAEAASWSAPGDRVQVSVNVSAAQLVDADAVDRVVDVLDRTRLVPDRLVLEITESALGEPRLERRLAVLRGLGIHVAIDDFGTGYSALRYVTRVDVDVVKIHHSFIERLGRPGKRPSRDDELVRAIAQFSHGLGIRTVAEGVTRPAQLVRVRELGCGLVQGDLTGAPNRRPMMSAADVDLERVG